MDLQLDTEQAILRDTAERFLAERYDDRARQATADREGAWRSETWREFARLGWLGLPFAPDDGGSGGGPVEIAVLMEAFGRHLVLEPYVATVILSGGLIASLASEAERQRLLAPIIDGRMVMAFAHEDCGAPATATPVSTGYLLSGLKKTVLGAPLAEVLLVSAMMSGGGRGVFWVPASSPGMTIKPRQTIDRRWDGDVAFDNVTVPGSALIGANGDAEASIDAVVERAIAALAADAVGAMTVLVTATVDYAKTRVQFGQPIGRFQALQHRLVDMKVKEEEARASCLFATLSLLESVGLRRRAVAGAKAKIGRCARAVYQDAIQLHGAIGTTNELPVGAYAKRLIAFESLFGTTREHLRRYARIIADPQVSAAALLGDGL
jgi:alkylation response protein AidB-like acyl-CoA dehydrogenase